MLLDDWISGVGDWAGTASNGDLLPALGVREVDGDKVLLYAQDSYETRYSGSTPRPVPEPQATWDWIIAIGAFQQEHKLPDTDPQWFVFNT